MKPLLLSCALTVLAVLPASARIGETLQDIEKKYGRPIGQSDVIGIHRNAYVSGNTQLLIGFLDNKSCWEVIIKTDKTAFTNEELQALLNHYGEGKSWTIDPEAANGTFAWKRSDDRVGATYGDAPPVPQFSFIGKAFKKKLAAATAKQDADALKREKDEVNRMN